MDDDADNTFLPDRRAGRLPQVHYTAQSLQRDPGYSGPATIWDEKHASAVLSELIDYFGMGQRDRLPPPPTGLPGAIRMPFEEPVMELLDLGLAYMVAVAEGRPRRQIEAYQAAEQMVIQAYNGGWADHTNDLIKAESAREALARKQKKRNRRPPRVYFIGGTEGPIKIGFSSNPRSRLASLQTSSHMPLSILAMRHGTFDDERKYHERFSEHRLSGEWFDRHPDILAEIERLSA